MRPWQKDTECPDEGYQEFKKALMSASYHNAGGLIDANDARSYTYRAAEEAIQQDWPYWALRRMFDDIKPLVDFDTFMQFYINTLKTRVRDLEKGNPVDA